MDVLEVLILPLFAFVASLLFLFCRRRNTRPKIPEREALLPKVQQELTKFLEKVTGRDSTDLQDISGIIASFWSPPFNPFIVQLLGIEPPFWGPENDFHIENDW